MKKLKDGMADLEVFSMCVRIWLEEWIMMALKGCTNHFMRRSYTTHNAAKTKHNSNNLHGVKRG